MQAAEAREPAVGGSATVQDSPPQLSFLAHLNAPFDSRTEPAAAATASAAQQTLCRHRHYHSPVQRDVAWWDLPLYTNTPTIRLMQHVPRRVRFSARSTCLGPLCRLRSRQPPPWRSAKITSPAQHSVINGTFRRAPTDSCVQATSSLSVTRRFAHVCMPSGRCREKDAEEQAPPSRLAGVVRTSVSSIIDHPSIIPLRHYHASVPAHSIFRTHHVHPRNSAALFRPDHHGVLIPFARISKAHIFCQDPTRVRDSSFYALLYSPLSQSRFIFQWLSLFSCSLRLICRMTINSPFADKLTYLLRHLSIYLSAP
jgi:hypothetical protein